MCTFFCNECYIIQNNYILYVFFFSVTPLDVVKIRLQAQQKTVTNKCYIYCNGLMDHLCPCFPETGAGMNSNSHGVSQNWYERPGKYTGTFVSSICNVFWSGCV